VIPRAIALTALLLATIALATCVDPPRASASVGGTACKVAAAGGAVGKACAVLGASKTALSAGKKLVTGHIGSAINTIFGGSGSSGASTASTALGLAAMVAWVAAGAQFSISETTKVLGQTTKPQLGTTWFSSAYWRIAGIAALLTLPFLFAAAVQALLRSDLALLTRAAFGYLPLAMLAIGIAAPVTMLLLAATDELCAIVSSAAGAAGPRFDLAHAVIAAGAAPFLKFLVGVVTTAAAIVLWLELTVREAAVYVIVLMLPLAFAALVWPSRRVWAVRSVELLVALILSKLAIVAVLELGGAALDQLGHHGLAGIMAGLSGTALLLLAALSPWAVLRLVPLAELAGGAVDSLRAGATTSYQRADAERRGAEHKLVELGAGITARMRTEAHETGFSLDRTSGAEGEARRFQKTKPPERDGAVPREGAGGVEPPPERGDKSATQTRHSDDAERDDFRGHREERLSGLGAMFQAPNGSWRPLTLGPDGDWPHPQLWPPDGVGFSAEDERGSEHEPGPPGEDHDRLPQPQEKPEGSL
jgi:hypothetical protein